MMDKRKSEADLADFFLKEFPPSDRHPLPMPRFSKKISLRDQIARPLPGVGHAANTSDDDGSVAWFDDDDLGIRVFIIEEQGARGTEMCADVEGVRPDLLGKMVSVSLMAEKGRGYIGLSVSLDKPSEDKRGCSGKRSFGAAAEIRKELGDMVCIDVFLLE